MSINQECMQLIQQRLTKALSPAKLNIIDNSAKHKDHVGNNGGGHYSVEIISKAFVGKSNVERHQMVYQALGSAIGNEIHALSIKADELVH